MDPQACFRLFLRLSATGDRRGARSAARDYNAWRGKGGFPAVDTNGNNVDRLLPGEGWSVIDDEPFADRFVPLPSGCRDS